VSLSELEQAYGPVPEAPGEDRLPPQDVAAEQSAIGSMLLSKDAIGECSEILQSVDFYRPAHETIHEAVVDLYSRGEPVDAITVGDELSKRGDLQRIGGTAYLHQLIASVPTAANASYYAQIIAERAMLRRLVEAGTRIVQMGYAQGGGDVEEIVNSAQAEIYSVADRRKGEDYHALSSLLEPTMDEIELNHASTGEMVGVPTGFTSLDELTNGLHPGQMIIVAARPAVGKSTFALDIARAAAIRHQMPTVVFSLEMSRTEITMRLLSAESEIPLQAMRKGKLEDRHWTKLAETQGRLHEMPLFIDDSPNMALMEIRAKCRRLKQRNNLKLVIVDYLQLMSSGKRVESRQQEVAEFSRALKLLAKELEVPVIALSQLNRGPEQRTDKKPQMSDLRESGSIEQDADVVILLHRESMYERESPREGEADVIVAKHRNGPTDTLVVAFQGHYSRFTNMATNF
jgi:replicative DNA helicase